MQLPRTFQNRLIVTYLIISVLVIFFLGFIVDLTLEKEAINHLRESLGIQANIAAQFVDTAPVDQRDIDTLDAIAKKVKRLTGCRTTIIAVDGEVLGDSDEPREKIPLMENHRYRPEVKQALSGQFASSIRYSDTVRQKMLYVAIPLTGTSTFSTARNEAISSTLAPSVNGVIRLAIPLKTVQALRWSIRHVVFVGALIALFVSILTGVLMARSVTSPIKEINRISAQYTAGDLSKKIYVDSVTEINQLAETLNRMAEEIQAKITLIQNEKNEIVAIVNSMVEGVIAVDNNLRVISVNPAFAQMFNINHLESTGKLLMETIRNNELNELAAKVLQSGENITAEITLLVPIEKTIEVIGSPLFSNREISGCVLVIHDVTDLRKLERMRKEFVANVSHELKTPLTAIKGYIETLLDGAIDDRENSRRFLTIVESHTNRLIRIVDDVLQLSELESKGIVNEFQAVELKPLLDEILPIFTRQLAQRDIQVKLNLPASLSAIRANREQLKEVFLNLLDNAIKFNQVHGTIEITAIESDREISVSISDTGIGIPEQDLPRIFERFYRVDKTRSRDLGGTGLGLAIVKHIIDQHNGTITVTSELGRGSCFRFALPKMKN